jgi:hypothetical protein
MTVRPESSSRLAEPPRAGPAALGLLLLTASFAALRLPLIGELRIIDTPVYELYGEQMAAGEIPYRDFALEYPPGALPAFLLPTLGPADEYAAIFELLMWACGVAAIVFVVRALAAADARPWRLYAAAAFVGLAPLALGPVILSRYDLWPAALAAAAVAAFVSGRERIGFGALALAVATKIYPLVLLPLALIWTARRRGPREAAVGGGVFLLALSALVVPFAVLSADGLADSLGRQLGRPLQIESLGGSLLLVAHQLGWYRPAVVSSYGSQNLAGGLPDALAVVLTVLQALAVLAVWTLWAYGRAGRERLFLASAAAVVAFVALGKVASPQFLIWLLPLVPLVGGAVGLTAAFLLGAALVTTQLWFPSRYWNMVGLGAEAWLVLLRDLLLLALFGVLLAALARRERGPPRSA